MPKKIPRAKWKKGVTAFFDAASAIPANVPWLVPITVEIIEATTGQTDINSINPDQFDYALIAALLVSVGLVTIKEAIYLLTNIEESEYKNYLRLAQYIKLITLDLLLPIAMSITYLAPNWGDMDFNKANDETGTPSAYQSAKLLLSLLVIIPCAFIANRNFIYQEAIRFKNAGCRRIPQFISGNLPGEEQPLNTHEDKNQQDSIDQSKQPEKNFDDNIYDKFSGFWCKQKFPQNSEEAKKNLDNFDSSLA